MSLYFKTHILYCRRPDRIQRFLIELFEAELKEHSNYHEVRLYDQHFVLKELPAASINDEVGVLLNQSFCLATNDRHDLNDIEGRFQFFQFKEISRPDEIKNYRVSREKIQRIQDSNFEGVLLFDDDGRSWTLMYEKNLETYNSSNNSFEALAESHATI